uniref:Uncharacterized protein n=1 Tax=Dicentrarchus labrax TaxID=13489 RepID=A0A8C4EIT3_DICLA
IHLLKMSDNPVTKEVETFNKSKLRKTATEEKNHMPTKDGKKSKGK